ncbi:hypothetical protein ACT453_11760 [Bacillus sp. D-CC]
MMNNRISYKEFEDYPQFENREEAVKWLKEKYGKDFFFFSERNYNKEPLYCHIYVLNRETYNRMQEYKNRTKSDLFPSWDPETRGFTSSFQEILIWDDGKVQVQSPAM